MAIVEISKIRQDLAKLLEKDNLLAERAIKEFSLKKGVSTKEILEKKGDWMLILELNRYISKLKASYKDKFIPKDVSFERIDANGVPADWVINAGASEQKIIFFLFGGGYVMGTLETRKWLPYLLGRATKMRCLNIGYRLAPEHPFPAGLEDSVKAYRWLLSTGISANNIVIAGASAGGGMTMATLLKLRELNQPLPAAAIMLSPWVDLTGRGKSIKTNAIYEPELASAVRLMAGVYLQGERRKNPLASPVHANLEGLPPMLIQAGSIEVLRDDSALLAERAESAGVVVTLEIWEGMTHVFQNFGDDLPDSKQAIEHIAEFIRKILS